MRVGRRGGEEEREGGRERVRKEEQKDAGNKIVTRVERVKEESRLMERSFLQGKRRRK